MPQHHLEHGQEPQEGVEGILSILGWTEPVLHQGGQVGIEDHRTPAAKSSWRLPSKGQRDSGFRPRTEGEGGDGSASCRRGKGSIRLPGNGGLGEQPVGRIDRPTHCKPPGRRIRSAP
jgi:hypothetical protein